MGIGSEVKRYNSFLKIVFLVLAIFTMVATVCLTVLFVLPGIKDPVSLLKYSRIWYVILSFVLFGLWTGVVVLLVKLETHVMKQKSTGMIVLASIINMVALLWLFISLILSAARFSSNVGTIKISNAEELSYIRNYPSGEYELTKDIDMKGEEWKSISKFKGSINGNGHSIINITIGNNGIIKKNLGEISSLTLSKVQYTDFKLGKEFGSLVKINRGSVLNCAISSTDDKANPLANFLVGCNYGICKNNTGICNDRCEEHTFELVSSTSAIFFKHGINSYLCEVCGDTYTSVAVYGQPFKLLVAILLLLAAVAGIIIIIFSDGEYKYISVPLLGIVALFMAFEFYSYETVGVNAGKGETWIDRRLITEEQTEINMPKDSESNSYSTGSDEGSMDFDWASLENYAAYTEESAQTVKESENNNSVDKATEVDMFSTVVGNLSSEKDVDYYCFTIAVKSNMTFQFSHQANEYSNHWDACIYGTNGVTVLKEGYIASAKTSEFTVSDLAPGTYYLKISNASGVNPIMFSFSDSQYAITFIPACIEHLDYTQYIYTHPMCTEMGEIISICNECRETISLDEIKAKGHSWGEWETTQEATWIKTGERTRICSDCKEVESEKVQTLVWVMPFVVFALAIIIIGSVLFFKHIGNSIPYRLASDVCIIALMLFLSTIIGGYILVQTPLGLSLVQVNLILAVFCSINLLLIMGMVSNMFHSMRYVAAIVISILMIAFLFLVRTLIMEKCVLALAILFGVMALVNIILACVAYSDIKYRWMVFAIGVAVVALGFSIAFGVMAKKQSSAVPASDITSLAGSSNFENFT